MQFLTLLFVPHIAIWLLTRSRRAYRWLLIVATFTIQLFAILPIAILFIVVSGKTSTGVDSSVVGGNKIYASVDPSMLMAMDYPLRISWYDPSLGGTNCDHDCTTMASGDKVQSWIGGRGGVYAAACPRSDGWYHGQRFELDGVIYECRDTGGWINCYQPGQYDPALRRNAEMAYCWVDLLNGSQYQYGSLAYDWSLIR